MANQKTAEVKTSSSDRPADRSPWRVLLYPLWLISRPFVLLFRTLDNRFLSYITGRTVRDSHRVYSIKFVWYGDTIYLHPMVWGSALLFAFARTEILTPGWPLLVWYVLLAVCFLTIMYNFDVIRVSILGIGVVAFLGIAYFSTVQLAWNPLSAVARHVAWLEVRVSPGFYIASSYLFALLICSEVIWAWLFHRVEIDESYVYEHRFLKSSTREPIFARSMRRETKDLLELLILGAADIQHRTRNGVKRFKNVPFASLWVGTAIDNMLDYRRKGEVELTKRGRDDDDDDDQSRVEDAFQDVDEDWDDGGDDEDNGDDAANDDLQN